MLRCLVATLGKDAPGINAALRAATRFALRNGMEVYGAKRGFVGIVNENFHKLRDSDVAYILSKGGSLLGSSDFRISPQDKPTLVKVARVLRKFDVTVVTGGLGSFANLSHVYSSNAMGPATTMFIPASVENDFLNPRRSFQPGGEEGVSVHAEAIGADTATNTAVEAIDRLRGQSYLSHTVFLVQCAGAKSNFLPVSIGMACGAHRVYLPQYPLLHPEAKAEIQRLFGEKFDPNMVNVKEMLDWIQEMFKDPRRTYLLVIVPHGVPMISFVHSTAMSVSRREDYESIIMSTAPMELTVPRIVDDLAMHFAAPGPVQIRCVVLDDLQRGGTPTARDRVLGSLYGRAAVERFLSALQQQEIGTWGNLNLVGLDDTSGTAALSFPREEVAPVFQGTSPRAGGLDPLPFFRQNRGTASGYATLSQS